MTTNTISRQVAAIMAIASFALGAASAGYMSGLFVSKIESNTTALEAHLERGPHKEAADALILIERDISDFKASLAELKDIMKEGTKDRYYRTDAKRDREHLCTANPNISCPDIF